MNLLLTKSSSKPICDHKLPNDKCKVVVKVFRHSTCDHKVVVRCRDQGIESFLWCNKNITLICQSCNFIQQNQSGKCRIMLMRNINCQLCKKEILLPNQLPELIRKVEEVKPDLSAFNLPIQPLSSAHKVMHISKATDLSTRAPECTTFVSKTTLSVKPKCDHKIPNGTCQVVVKVFKHSTCDHKVVMRCCDQGKESSLWCDKTMSLICHSCSFPQNKSVKCRSILMGNHHCQKCQIIIELPNKLPKQIRDVEQTKLALIELGLPIKMLSSSNKDMFEPRSKCSSMQAPENQKLISTPASSARVKCDHKTPHDGCKVVLRFINHSICNHKVAVRCCNQGKESSLWCDRVTKLSFHSCDWRIPKKNVTCRLVPMGNHQCPKCNKVIMSRTQLQAGAPIKEVHKNLPKAKIQTWSPVKSRKEKHKCSIILKCGHRCPLDASKEHSQLHLTFKCVARCIRTCLNGHECFTSHKCSTYCTLTDPTCGCQHDYDYVFKCGHLTGATIKCAEVTKKGLKKLIVNRLCNSRCDY